MLETVKRTDELLPSGDIITEEEDPWLKVKTEPPKPPWETGQMWLNLRTSELNIFARGVWLRFAGFI